jgi:hypothetical protein
MLTIEGKPAVVEVMQDLAFFNLDAVKKQIDKAIEAHAAQ